MMIRPRLPLVRVIFNGPGNSRWHSPWMSDPEFIRHYVDSRRHLDGWRPAYLIRVTRWTADKVSAP